MNTEFRYTYQSGHIDERPTAQQPELSCMLWLGLRLLLRLRLWLWGVLIVLFNGNLSPAALCIAALLRRGF